MTKGLPNVASDFACLQNIGSGKITTHNHSSYSYTAHRGFNCCAMLFVCQHSPKVGCFMQLHTSQVFLHVGAAIESSIVHDILSNEPKACFQNNKGNVLTNDLHIFRCSSISATTQMSPKAELGFPRATTIKPTLRNLLVFTQSTICI